MIKNFSDVLQRITREKALIRTIAIGVFCLFLGMIWVSGRIIFNSHPSVQAGLLGLSGAMFAGILAHRFSQKREIAARHFSEKQRGYLHFVDAALDLVYAKLNNKEITSQDTMEKIIKFKRAIMVWGSLDLIKAWYEYEETFGLELSDVEQFQEFEKMFRAIRKDLGHDDRKLPSGYLVGILLKSDDKHRIISALNRI